jgi:C-terminal processing protease CtpA/Prc
MRHQHRDPFTGEPGVLSSTYLDLNSSPCIARSERNLWFLIGPGCSSTAEILASAFRVRTGVRFIGEPTAGCVGDPVEFRLPRLLLGVTIPIAKYFFPGTGMPIEGRGVLPDLHVTQTASDLQMGVDTALASIVRTIREAS